MEVIDIINLYVSKYIETMKTNTPEEAYFIALDAVGQLGDQAEPMVVAVKNDPRTVQIDTAVVMAKQLSECKDEELVNKILSVLEKDKETYADAPFTDETYICFKDCYRMYCSKA